VVEVIGLLSGSPVRAGRTSFPLVLRIPHIHFFNKRAWTICLFEVVESCLKAAQSHLQMVESRLQAAQSSL
jgi:hypothetical protein